IVAALLFFPERPLMNVASPFSSVRCCMSAPVSLMSPLLFHTERKGTRAGHLAKVVPITWCNFHYMVPVPLAVKAGMMKRGSEKRDYRNLWRVGRIVHMDLFYRRGEKRKYQLQGGRIVSPGDCRLCCFDEKIFIPGLVAFAHNLSI